MSEIPQYSQLVLSVCETLQEEAIALFDQTRHCLMSGDSAEDKDSMETDDASRHKQKDQRDGASDVRPPVGQENIAAVSFLPRAPNGAVLIRACR